MPTSIPTIRETTTKALARPCVVGGARQDGGVDRRERQPEAEAADHQRQRCATRLSSASNSQVAIQGEPDRRQAPCPRRSRRRPRAGG